MEWGIPNQEVFDCVVALAVRDFTQENPDLILSLAWSSTGWDTGVGLVALTTDNMKTIDDFRRAVSGVEHEGQKFVTVPKQMLMKKYALSVYFGRQFAIFETHRLMYWLGLCNNLSGEFELVETRNFSKTHELSLIHI